LEFITFHFKNYLGTEIVDTMFGSTNIDMNLVSIISTLIGLQMKKVVDLVKTMIFI